MSETELSLSQENKLDTNLEDSINEFYKLKSIYETNNYANIKSIMNNKSLSLIEKKREYQRIKPKCVNCKKPGGTLFTIYKKKDKEDSYTETRILKAKCNVVEDPCNLNINIELANYESYFEIIKELNDMIHNTKQKIINNKNNMLFGYLTNAQAIVQFQELKEEINGSMELYTDYLNDYMTIVDNKEKTEELNEELVKQSALIQSIKDAMNNYELTGEVQYVKDIIHMYDTQLKPINHTIMDLKYKENYVWYNEDDGTYKLVQNKYGIKDIEHVIGNNKVLNFDVGIKIKYDKNKKK